MRLYHPDMATLARLLTALLRRTPPVGEPLSDAELLARFVNARDAAAFELLVWRHGAMVLGVCRRMLRHEQSAEDAFQAVFLILAKKAGAVRTQLAGWLHTTARRVCLRMGKRTAFAVLEAEPPAAVPPDALANAELAALLDAEIARLPKKFRLAVVLCYLRGLTTEQAAAQLNVPRGTVLSRLASARKRLVERLTAKGVTVPSAFLTTAVTTGELAADVCGRTATAALGFVTSDLAVTVPSQLATEVLSMTIHKTVLAVAVAVVLMTGVGTGLGWVLADGDQPGDAPKPAAKAEQPKAKPESPEERLREEKSTRDATERAEKMKAISDLLDRERRELNLIREVQAVRNMDSDAVFLRKANEELLVEVAKQVFAAEVAVADVKFDFDRAEKAYQPYQEGMAERLRLSKLSADLAQRRRDIEEKLRAAQAEFVKLAQDAPKFVEAKKLVDALSDESRTVAAERDALDKKSQKLPRISKLENDLADAGAVMRKKQAHVDHLKMRQERLIGELAKGRKGDVWGERMRDAEIDMRIERMRKLRELSFELELQKSGLTATPGGMAAELEELRREVKKLQAERK